VGVTSFKSLPSVVGRRGRGERGQENLSNWVGGGGKGSGVIVIWKGEAKGTAWGAMPEG